MRPVAIIGTGQSDHARRRDDVSQPELVREAASRALADAALRPSDIDAVVISNMELFEGRALPELWVGEGAFANGKPCMKVATGGTSGTSACIAGFHQAASGLFDVVLVVGFEKHSEGHTQTGMALTDPFWDRAVASGALGNFALSISQYMAERGVTRVLEIGPGRVLTGLIRRIDSKLARGNLSTLSELTDAAHFAALA